VSVQAEDVVGSPVDVAGSLRLIIRKPGELLPRLADGLAQLVVRAVVDRLLSPTRKAVWTNRCPSRPEATERAKLPDEQLGTDVDESRITGDLMLAMNVRIHDEWPMCRAVQHCRNRQPGAPCPLLSLDDPGDCIARQPAV
jgi:hypothetical protein